MGVINIGFAEDEYFYPGTVSVATALKSYTGLRSIASYGGEARLKSTTVLSAALSGGTSNVGTTPILDGWFVLGVTIYVKTLITGCTSFKIGDGSDDDKWGASIALTAGTTTTGANFTASPSLYTSDTNIVLTAVGGGASFSAGVVRATVHYIDFTAMLAG